MQKVKVGVVGCGNISSIYLKSLTQVFKNVEVVACADMFLEKAKQRAEEFRISKACSVEELLANPEIEIVVNLTIPASHTDINIAVLNAGMNVYVEKTLALNREDAKMTLKLAREKGLLVGCAPDTFLGAGLQTCRKLIDDGWIGIPTLVSGMLVCGGPESWHPDPEFLYQKGAGPLFDMGPYYITAMVALLGSVSGVTGFAKTTFQQRTITSMPKFGKTIGVEVATNIAAVLDFECGAIGTLVTSVDASGYLPRLEVFGTEGVIIVSDPNTFEGPIKIKRHEASEWSQIPLTHGYHENSRGIGVADMAQALISGRKHRANGELAYHVLDVICSMLESSNELKHYYLESRCESPKALPTWLAQGTID
jgi:predicted dehydrogenase